METKFEYKLPKTFLGKLWRKYISDIYLGKIITGSVKSGMSNHKPKF